MRRRFNIKIFLISLAAIFLLTWISFYGAAAADEGTDGGSTAILLLSRLYDLLRFPTHTLYWETFNKTGLFSVGLLFNSLLYALVFERVYSLFKPLGKPRKNW